MTEVPTYTAQIYIAGDLAQAKRLCQQRFMTEGLCVTLGPVDPSEARTQTSDSADPPQPSAAGEP
jgi:hypothetical protein